MKPNWRSTNRQSRILDLLTIFVVFAFLFPYLFMVSSAFQVAGSRPSPIRRYSCNSRRRSQHFENIFSDMNILFYMKNSTIIAVCSTLLTILIAIPATYSLRSLSQFRNKEGIAYGFPLLADGAGHIDRIRACSSSRAAWNLFDTHIFLIVVYLLVECALRHLDDAWLCRRHPRRTGRIGDGGWRVAL